MRLQLPCVVAAFAAASLLLCACGGSNTCNKTAMSCVAVSECSADKGHLTSLGSCDNVAQVCCVPALSCPAENFHCCGGDVGGDAGGVLVERPYCDNGVLTCPAELAQCM